VSDAPAAEPEKALFARVVVALAPYLNHLVVAGGWAHRLYLLHPARFAPWLEQAEASQFAELRDFAAGLRRDARAVEAALTQPWSNGQTEGQVTKLKRLERRMYGRAGVPLLRQRMLLAAYIAPLARLLVHTCQCAEAGDARGRVRPARRRWSR